MSKELISRKGEFINQTALQQIEHLSQKLITSNALPSTITNGAQLMMVLLSGYDAGMTPMEAINSYYIVNGKITIWGDAVLRQLRKAGWQIKWEHSDEQSAKVTISKDGITATEEYTIEEAKKAGLFGKAGIWEKYTKVMLRHKVVAQAVRFNCPEVLGGMYMKEEIDGVDQGFTPPKNTVKLPENNKYTEEILSLTKQLGSDENDVRDWIRQRWGCEIENLLPEKAELAITAMKEKLEQQKSDDVIDAEFQEKTSPEAKKSPISEPEPENELDAALNAKPSENAKSEATGDPEQVEGIPFESPTSEKVGPGTMLTITTMLKTKFGIEGAPHIKSWIQLYCDWIGEIKDLSDLTQEDAKKIINTIAETSSKDTETISVEDAYAAAKKNEVKR